MDSSFGHPPKLTPKNKKIIHFQDIHTMDSPPYKIIDHFVKGLNEYQGKTRWIAIEANIPPSKAKQLQVTLDTKSPGLVLMSPPTFKFYHNSGALDDVGLARRLNEIPFNMTIEQLKELETDSGKSLTVVLNVTCPMDQPYMDVTAQHLLFEGLEDWPRDMLDEVWMYPHTFVCRLSRGESIHLTAQVEASDPSKTIINSTICCYIQKPKPRITIKRPLGFKRTPKAIEKLKRWSAACPQNIFDIEELTSWSLNPNHPFSPSKSDKCTFCRRCEQVDKGDDDVEDETMPVLRVTSDDTIQLISFGSIGPESPESLLNRAFQQIENE